MAGLRTTRYSTAGPTWMLSLRNTPTTMLTCLPLLTCDELDSQLDRSVHRLGVHQRRHPGRVRRSRIWHVSYFTGQERQGTQESGRCSSWDYRLLEKLSLIHISEPTRQAEISYAVFCL